MSGQGFLFVEENTWICRNFGFNGVIWSALDRRFGYDMYVAGTPIARALAPCESGASHGEGGSVLKGRAPLGGDPFGLVIILIAGRGGNIY